MSIALTSIHKHYAVNGAVRTILAGATLHVDPGQVVCLMGDNGCGKTTLLKIAASLVLPERGTVHIMGIDALTETVDAHARLAYVGSGEHGFYQSLSVAENLLFAGRVRALSPAVLRERIGSLSEEFGITAWLREPVAHCSSGIRRRIALVRAALHRPTVWLLDEPTVSLDEDSRQALLSFLKDEAVRGCSVLMVTHSPVDAGILGAPVVRLEHGMVSV